jgi:hypothetical protein
MLRFLFILVVVASTITGAYFTAQSKIAAKSDLSALKLGMDLASVKESFGVPTSEFRNILTYILPNSSVLTITLRDDVVTSAKVKFIQPVTVTDPELRKLTLVQMEPALNDEKPSWFFAGAPELGLIYKITADGIIESLTWVEPFTLHSHHPKNVQALLRDFKSTLLTNM